jgi:hypothetical protein
LSEAVYTGPALTVLGHLAADLRRALANPPSPEACRALLYELNEVGVLAAWCRDAGVVLGRRTDPRLTFKEMQRIAGVPDSTLHDRYRRWIDLEQEG